MNERKIGWLSFSKKDIRYYVLVGVFVALSMWTWGYVSLLNSDVFDFSRNHIVANPKFNEDLGTIRSMRLGFVNFQRKYAGGVWTVKFNVVVEGSHKSGTVYVDLKNSGDGWIVENERLELNNTF